MDEHEANPSSEALMTPQEVAAFLNVPLATLRVWRTRGDGGPPGYRVGRHVRFKREEVEEWLAARADAR